MAKGTLALHQIKLGDNADTSKNFVISVPAVADGTLVIERGDGTDVLSVAADGKVTLTPTIEMTPIGVGQTWQNVTASRALNEDYVNSTGRPLLINVSAILANMSYAIKLYVDDIEAGYAQGTSTAGIIYGTSAIVPAGATYRVTTSGSPTLDKWTELR